MQTINKKVEIVLLWYHYGKLIGPIWPKLAKIGPIFSLIDPGFKFTQTSDFWKPSINSDKKLETVQISFCFGLLFGPIWPKLA